MRSVAFGLFLSSCSFTQDEGQCHKSLLKAFIIVQDIQAMRNSLDVRKWSGYESVVNAIVRPPRAYYNYGAMGPLTLSLHGMRSSERYSLNPHPSCTECPDRGLVPLYFLCILSDINGKTSS